jgi:hypothetical protein
MTDTATAVAAWYPDPAGHADLRWWDGTRWTAEVQSANAGPLGLSAPIAPAARGAHVAEVAPPETPTAPTTPAEERAALYAARREAHFAEALPTQDAGRAATSGQFGARPFGATEEPDRFRVAYEEKTYQAWRKNSAATSALVFAGINLALLVYAFFQHYSPYYRIVPSVIGITAAVLALRQARQTETGLIKSVVALILNAVIGAVAAFALLQLLLGIGTALGDDVHDLVDTPNAVYSEVVESTIQANSPTDQGRSVLAVDCPVSMQRDVGLEYDCTETLADGSTRAITVRVTSTDGSFEYTVEDL